MMIRNMRTHTYTHTKKVELGFPKQLKTGVVEGMSVSDVSLDISWSSRLLKGLMSRKFR